MATLHYIGPTETKHLTNLDLTNLDLKRGDLVCLNTKEKHWRNDDVYIFDGITLIELSTEYDDYGHIPPEFEVSDNGFGPNHWRDVIDHNGYFFPVDEIRQRALASIKIGTFEWFDEPLLHSIVTIGDEEYTLFFDHVLVEDYNECQISDTERLNIFQTKIKDEPWSSALYNSEICIPNCLKYLVV